MARILLIDDEPFVTSALSEALEHAGYEVSCADNGKQGMAQYATCPCDLVITDILMPEQDGIEVIMQLRRQSPRAKILAISGAWHHGLDYLQVAKKLGADSAIHKPFRMQNFLAEVRRLLAT